MNPKEKADRTGSVALRLLIAGAICLGIPLPLFAQSTIGPSWWYNAAFTVSGTTPAVNGTANDYAAVNQGQVKNLAVTAVNELDYDLAQFGGAGPTLDSLAVSLSATSGSTSDFSAVNLGQLKALAKPFYDWLLALGYTQGPLTTGTYPWVGLTPSDYSMANIGQVKNLFSFDVTYSTAGDGLPDWWLIRYFGGLTISGTAIDPGGYVAWSGTQVTILEAFQNGWNPIDFYSGLPPMLTIVSGNDQTGPPGGFVPAPLVVSVTDSNGNAIVSAPVTFAVTTGSGSLQPSSGGTSGTSVTTFTDYSGSALMYFQLSSATSSSSQVTVTTGTGSSFTSGTFTAYSDNGTGVFQSPFAPTNVIGTVNSDGSLTLTWTNNADDALYILIEQLQSGTWQPVSLELSGTTTSYTITSPTPGTYRVDPQTPNLATSGTNSNPSPGAFVPIPVQTYAAIDVSGSTTSQAVSMIALDDSNNMAFAYIGTSGRGPISNTWVNAIVTSTNTAPYPGTESYVDSADPSMSGTFTTKWLPGGIGTSGSLYGSVGCTPSGGSSPAAYLASICANSNVNYLDVNSSGLGLTADFNSLSQMASDGTPQEGYITGCSSSSNNYFGVIKDAIPDLYFITRSGTTTIFIGLQSSGTYAASSTLVISATSFQPTAINDSGSAIGLTGTGYDPYTSDNETAVFWPGNGSTFTPLAPMEDPIAISDANQVVGATGTTGYLWTSGSTTSVCPLVISGSVQTIYSLIPAPYQSDILSISPIDISGTNATDGSVRILMNAEYVTGTTGVTGTGTFLLTLTSGTSAITSGTAETIFQEVQLPSGVNTDLGLSGMLNSQGLIAGIGNITITGTNGVATTGTNHALVSFPAQINAYRPQMVPNSIDISSTDPTQNIIPQSEVSGTGVHIRVNGDNENTNLVEVTFSSPTIAAMSNLGVAVQRSGTNLVVWSSSNKATSIISSGNQGNLTLDGSGNATIWVEALAQGTNSLSFVVTSGTANIGTSGSLNFVNYDSYTVAFSGETRTSGTAGDAKAQAQGIFNVAQRLYLDGYNIAYYNVYNINDSTGLPAYGELSNQIQHGYVKSVRVCGYSHGGGETYNICSLLSSAGGTLGTFNITFAGYVDAIEHSGPIRNGTLNFFAETQYPPGAAYLWNYYQTLDHLHGNSIPAANPNIDVTTQTTWGTNLYHYSRDGKTGIDDSPFVQQALTSAIESNVPKY